MSDASGARRRLAAAHAATGVKVDFEIAVANADAGTEVGRVLTDFVENKPELLIKTMKVVPGGGINAYPRHRVHFRTIVS